MWGKTKISAGISGQPMGSGGEANGVWWGTTRYARRCLDFNSVVFRNLFMEYVIECVWALALQQSTVYLASDVIDFFNIELSF